ncbi:5'-methylthioadenosine/adenosylhomocysteine nucleosidase [Ottowia sp.]|uniref:5'-methylthioadenosine/adenosylhomocysteine nucleosidase n=1 Tax=Ottowia sp. TaxID=1898956 RepID=UPI002D1B0795|nr:5'-methylthioadenosine/adenosylhomocysteine nucleosidase [Ottowia sp.]HOB65801.1 5'-methylthioadenosine/adenosylhomocysteine nucleosidase [Ottowia sp.]HPZ56642.1 5'-methylthioadenosine/adenosylhomocysteine nucleosidase [Ottowia sp.]HQD47107.1 5'-methylthioadenosine/adenosylhomocysteine nucleosidase [Ottowia sp.]
MKPTRRTGIVSAMQQELSAVLARMPDEQRQRVAGRDFWVGHWHGHEVVAVLSRVGKVAAATTAAVLIERFGVDRIVFTGTAGGLGDGVRVGDLVLADGFVQHDMDASPLFPRFEVPLYGRARFDTDGALSAALGRAARSALALPAAVLGADAVAEFALHAPRVHSGLIASGDRFVATSAESAALRQALPAALAVEMEGAAVAQVCHDCAVPFAALRTISDRADDAAHVDFMRFIDRVASHYSAAILEAYFRSL